MDRGQVHANQQQHERQLVEYQQAAGDQIAVLEPTDFRTPDAWNAAAELQAVDLDARSEYRKDRIAEMETAIKYRQMLNQDVTQLVTDLLAFIENADPHLEGAFGTK